MNTEYLKYFIAACDSGSISKASRSLFISSQGLGQGIQKLEEQLGVQLLQRTSSGVGPTAFGELFYQQAKKVCSELDTLTDLLDRYKAQTDQCLHIGTIGNSKFFNNLEQCNVAYRGSNPSSTLSVELVSFQNVDELYHAIRQGNLDLGLLFNFRTLEDFDYYHISAFSPLMLMVSNGNPLAEQRSVSWEQLASQPLILPGKVDPFSDLFIFLCKLHDVYPERLFYSTENNTNASMIDRDMLAMPVRQNYSDNILHFSKNSKLIPLEPETMISISIITKKNRAFYGEKLKYVEYLSSFFEIFV
jgi:DNA-binding transcriptional LysR family regulator